MRRRFDRRVGLLAPLAGEAAPEERSAGGVVGAELQPHIVGVHRAAREEVPHPPRADHDIHPHRFARRERGQDLVERRALLPERPGSGVARRGGGCLLADREGGGQRQRFRAPGGRRAARRLRPAVAGEGEDVHRHLAGAEEVAHRLELSVESEVGRKRGVGGREAVGTQQSVPRRRILPRDRGHVAVGAGLRRFRVVEGTGALSRDPARLPVVVAVEAAQPAVVVHRAVEVHLVAGGAEGGAVPGVERLQERLAVRRRVEMDHEVVERPQQRVLGGREVVHRRVLDHEPGVPHGVLHPRDCVAGDAAEPGARGGAVHDLGQRPVHQPAEEDRVVVAAGAPLRRLGSHHALHVLDGAAVPGVVEGGEAVRRLAPLGGDVAVAAAALVAAEEEVLGNEAAVRRFRRGGEKRPVGAAHRFAGHRRRREPGVQHRRLRGQHVPEEAADRDRRRQHQRSGEHPPAGEESREAGGGGEVEVEERPGRGERPEDEEAGAAEHEDAAGDQEPPPQRVAAERGADPLPAPERELQRRNAEQRMQEDLRGVEEMRPAGRQQVAGVDQEQRRRCEEQPVSARHRVSLCCSFPPRRPEAPAARCA